MRILILTCALLGFALPALAAEEPAPTPAPDSAPAAAPAPAPAPAPAAAPTPAATDAPTVAPKASEKDLVEKEGYTIRLSLPTEEDRELWAQPGLRVELAVEGGLLAPNGPAPRIWGITFHLRTRLRIDRLWSMAATFGYTVARGDYTGVRWTAVVEPIFHPIPSLGISLAAGYGGLSISNPNVRFNASQETASRTLGPNERINNCTGGAYVAQARVEYLIVVGPLFSTGPYLLADGQWTSCSLSFGKTDRDTGADIAGRQWWLSLGGAVGWWLSWR
jgi:hypothetical protein